MTTKYVESQIKWTKNYYGQLVGMNIVGVDYISDDEGIWPVLICVGKDKEGDTVRYSLEISCDPEGNGPGFVFGLPHVDSGVK